jgi:hypothetical protein
MSDRGHLTRRAGERCPGENSPRFVANYVHFGAVSVVFARPKEKINQKLINMD